MAGRPVPVRLESALIQQLDALAKRWGVKRSSVIRLILRRALEDDAVKAVIDEEVIAIRARILEELGKAEARTRRALAARALGKPAPDVQALPSRGAFIEAESEDASD